MNSVLRLEMRRNGTAQGMVFGVLNMYGKYKARDVDIDTLPDSVQLKLAALFCCSTEPPTQDIPEVGTRISEDTFWVYLDDTETEWWVEKTKEATNDES